MNQLPEIQAALSLLGIEEFERELYQLLLKEGALPITTLANRLGVGRPTIYAALERLQQHGLLPEGRPEYSRGIQVEPPSRVLALLEEQQTLLAAERETLQRKLPELMAEYAVKTKLPALRLFEGRQQFIAVYEEALQESGQEMRYFGDALAFITLVGADYDKHWLKRRVKRGIFVKMLVFENSFTKSLQKQDDKVLRETRFLPDGLNFQSSYMLFGTSKTLLWNPLLERAIVLDDPVITTMFRELYDWQWQKCQGKDS